MPEAQHEFSDVVENLRRMIIKFRWWIIGATCVVTVATAVGLQFVPNRFTSEAVMEVAQQRVSLRYVDPANITQNPADVVHAMTQEVLSRSRLMGIIEEFKLYGDKRKTTPEDELTEAMRREVTIEPLDQAPGRTEFTTFKIAFSAETAELSHAVTARLTSLFIDENQKQRGEQANATNDFLSGQVTLAQQRLAQQEARLQAFKMQNLSQLPQAQQTNQSRVADLRIQLQSNAANASRAQQQQVALEQQRITLEASLASAIQKLQAERSILLGKYTTRHPEVIKKDDDIAKMQGVLARVRSHAPRVDTTPASSPEDATAVQLEAQVSANNAELSNLQKEDARIRGEISQLEGRINVSPLAEQQMLAIQNDIELARREYSDLKAKQTQSDLTAKVQQNREGERFRVVDPPTLPSSPTFPKRFRISLAAIGVGLVLGLALAFLLDKKDTSFHSEKVLKANFPLPLVLAVPLMPTPSEERALRKKKIGEWMAASAMAAGMAAVEAYVYLHRH